MVFRRSSAEELFRTLAQTPPADIHGKPSYPRVSGTSVNIHDVLVKRVLALGGIQESSPRTDVDSNGDASESKWRFRKPSVTFSAFLAPRELRQLAAAVGSLAGPDPSSGAAGGAAGRTTSPKSLRKHHDASAYSAHVSALPVLNLALDYLQAIPDLLLTHAGSPACRAMLACCRSGALRAILAELRRCASADPRVFGSPVGKATAELLLGLAQSHDAFLEASASPSSRDSASSDSALTGGTAARASSAGADVQAVAGEVVLALAVRASSAGADVQAEQPRARPPRDQTCIASPRGSRKPAEPMRQAGTRRATPHVGGGSGGASAGSAIALGRIRSSGGAEGALGEDDADGRRPSASSEQLTSLLTSGTGAAGEAGGGGTCGSVAAAAAGRRLRRQEAAGMSLAARAEVAARLHAAESAAAFAGGGGTGVAAGGEVREGALPSGGQCLL
ncbi:unnamed protein product [Closterium sp. Naga37s-1]|nr:unnamed protein product [Closterium sp. Naga37s-1]